MSKKLVINEVEVAVKKQGENLYLSMTDLAKLLGDPGYIPNWMRLPDTIEFLAAWEERNNKAFNYVGFDIIKTADGYGTNRFRLSAKEWIEKTNAVGIISTAGRYGGTYAHAQICFNFCYHFNPVYQLYVAEEYELLKKAFYGDQRWNLRRELARANYALHTRAVKDNLIPAELRPDEAGKTFAKEADMLNMIVFGMTAIEWRQRYPEKPGNLRDHASELELHLLSNLENLNHYLIQSGNSDRQERFEVLQEAYESQFYILARRKKGLLDGGND